MVCNERIESSRPTAKGIHIGPLHTSSEILGAESDYSLVTLAAIESPKRPGKMTRFPMD